jgi:hypothetical protein
VSDADQRAAIQAAANRLLAGTPLRSATGRLTVVELAVEAGVKRWMLTHKHLDLAQQFQARARALDGDPPPVAALKAQLAALQDDNRTLKARNAELQTLVEACAHIINELSIDHDRVTAERDQLLGNVRAITNRQPGS